MPDSQGREALSVIHINVPRALKARWVRESQAQGLKLTDWITHKLQARTVNVHKIPESPESPRSPPFMPGSLAQNDEH